MSPLYILFAIPFFLLLIGIEILVSRLRKQRWYRFNDAIANLNIGVGQQAVTLFSKIFLGGVYFYFFSQFGLFSIPQSVWSFLGALLLFDFLFYWAHRWSHEVNFLWGAHVVHHSSEEFNLSVALRQSWFHNLLAFFIFLPIPVMGFAPMTFFQAAAAHTIFQFWIHTEAIGKLPRIIEWIFNTPSHHRVHHGRNPQYIDKNHGGVLIIWDRLFGTFAAEDERPAYGITTPVKSWNPAWANLHYYAEMLQKMKLMSRWRDRLRMLVARPGWLPEELGGMQPVPEVQREAVQKFDARATRWLHAYVLVQFISILVGLSAFMYHFKNVSLFYQVTFFSILILSTMICSAVMENKPWVGVAEYIRLGLVALSLNSFYYFWHLDWFRVMLLASVGAIGVCMLWFALSRREMAAEEAV